MIEGSPKIDLQGAFSATGYFEDFAGGPVNPDLPPKQRPTSFRGRIIADVLDLTMQVSGEPVPRHLQLKRNQRVKLFRCY